MINIKEIVIALQKDVRRKNRPYLNHVKQINNNLMITCPYHKDGQEKSPSCGILLRDRVSHDKKHKAGTVHCFTCGATHSLEEMISFVLGYNDKGEQGKQWLLDNFQIISTEDISFDFSFELETDVVSIDYSPYKKYHPYFAKRGISPKVAEAFDLGYDEYYNSVVLPLFDKQGNCIMLIRRNIEEHIYMNTTGASKTDSVYGIHMIYKMLTKLQSNQYVYVVEGAFDALRLWQSGKPAVGILQASISDNQIDLIKKLPFHKIVIATDNDEAGRRVGKQLASKLANTKEVYFLQYPSGKKDPAELTDEEVSNMKLTRFHGKKVGFTTSLY